MIVFAFHFNRGAYLTNLVRSIERHINAHLIIVDDGSTDHHSLAALDLLSKKHEVVIKPRQGGFDRVTGGLHANMQWALETAAERGVDIALMIQEDMQIVRDLRSEDIATVTRGFDRPRSSFVIQTCFLKGNRGRQADNSAMYQTMAGLYERELTERAKRIGRCFSYSDTGFFSVPLFFQQMKCLQTGEKANELFLRERGLKMGFLMNPLMHFLPLPSDEARVNRCWQDIFADWLAGAGVHSISDMSKEEVEYLLSRDETELPYAESFLHAPTMPKSNYWSLRSGLSNLHARGGWRKAVARLLPK